MSHIERPPAELAAELGRFGPVRLAAVLSLLPAETLAAALLGVEVAHLRVGAALDADYLDGMWHRQHPLPAYTDVQRCRYPPDGDRAAWIRNGPPGHVDYVPGQEAAA